MRRTPCPRHLPSRFLSGPRQHRSLELSACPGMTEEAHRGRTWDHQTLTLVSLGRQTTRGEPHQGTNLETGLICEQGCIHQEPSLGPARPRLGRRLICGEQPRHPWHGALLRTESGMQELTPPPVLRELLALKIRWEPMKQHPASRTWSENSSARTNIRRMRQGPPREHWPA